jgi:hypothetical protein
MDEERSLDTVGTEDLRVELPGIRPRGPPVVADRRDEVVSGRVRVSEQRKQALVLAGADVAPPGWPEVLLKFLKARPAVVDACIDDRSLGGLDRRLHSILLDGVRDVDNPTAESIRGDAVDIAGHSRYIMRMDILLGRFASQIWIRAGSRTDTGSWSAHLP